MEGIYTPSGTDLRLYQSNGYLKPIRVLTSSQCSAIANHFVSNDHPKPERWWKGGAIRDRFAFDIATSERILHPVQTVLGPNVVLWGMQYLRREPGQEHSWHSDIETVEQSSHFASVWVGISGTSAESGLVVVAKSHRFGQSIQQTAFESGVSRAGISDTEVIGLARNFSDHAYIDRPEAGDGLALIFSGGLWHMSHNTSGKVRTSLLIQFSTPEVVVRIPDWTRLDWPYQFTNERAPSLIACGSVKNTDLDLRKPPDAIS
ncbi:phytanoyl-CoA dioxygenase family protein [Gordonia amicalis]|uniref:phytanoyl-CoA dioxygenase family protein n=1 Tax=Gordonia amicalis TaxID=89053 RepID=UPI0037C02702